MGIGISPLFEKVHIPSPPLFKPMIDQFRSRGTYSDIPQVPLIRPVLTDPLHPFGVVANSIF